MRQAEWLKTGDVMRESEKTFSVRNAIYQDYTGKNFMEFVEREFNGILGTNYRKEDYRNIIGDCRVKRDFNSDFEKNPQTFYQTSKAFVFANAVYNLNSMGFSILKAVKEYYVGGNFLDYGGGTGNCNIIARGGDYIDLPGIMYGTARSRFETRDIKVNMIEADTNRIMPLQKKYSFIVCTDVLEHVPFAHELARQLVHALQPGGKLALNYSFGTSDTNKTHLPIYDRGTGREILSLLRENGLKLAYKDFKGITKIFEKET